MGSHEHPITHTSTWLHNAQNAGIGPSGLRRWLYHEEAWVRVMVLFTHDCDGLCPTDVRTTSEKPILGWLILCVNYEPSTSSQFITT